MLGAIIGDILGNGYDFGLTIPKYEEVQKKYDELFKTGIEINPRVREIFTDDTVMTVAIGKALSQTFDKPAEEIKLCLRYNMQMFGRSHITAGYGTLFSNWLISQKPEPYESIGNGSAMRVSSVGWLANNLNEVDIYARLTAEVTHNSEEGIKGAQAIASAIFLARNGSKKEAIKKYIEKEYGYDLSKSIEVYRSADIMKRDALCETAVIQAMAAFLESENFEDAVIKAVTIGGDTDTIAAITGSIAEAYYRIDEKAKELVLTYLPDDLKRGINDYTYIVMYRRNERKKAYDKIFDDIKYFKERIKEDTGRPIPMFMFNQPEMSEEVERLINIAHLPEITDKAYIDTLDLHNIEMDSDLYRENAADSGAYLLRAMLTSIVRQEIFNPGAVDKCVDDGTVYVLLEEMKKKKVYR